MTPKEKAQKILEIAEYITYNESKLSLIIDTCSLAFDVANAYLELEKKLSLEQQDRKSEKREFKVFKDAAENEITKLKKSREALRKAVDKILNGKFILDYGIIAREALKADDEIMGCGNET